jgi:hypothetical protein
MHEGTYEWENEYYRYRVSGKGRWVDFDERSLRGGYWRDCNDLDVLAEELLRMANAG